jgi:prepilin-type N-terminal cleavage/methylation domain-containing protein
MKDKLEIRNQKPERNAEKKGFTLLEILITTVIIFLIFSLVYMTFFSVSRITSGLQEKMRESEIFSSFLDTFYREVKSLFYEKDDFKFDRKEISFISLSPEEIYPVKITYTVYQTENGEMLLKKQENLLTGYSFIFPVIENAQEIYFLTYSGESWQYFMENEEVPQGLGIEFVKEDKEFFYPVKLNGVLKEEGKEKE